MTIGKSGWSDEVAQQEGPYGMGFLAAIYAAKRVHIASRGKHLAFFTADALADGEFEVTQGQTPRSTRGAGVVLYDFDWLNYDAAIRRMALGFAVPLNFNGLELDRLFAQDETFVATEVGHVRLGKSSDVNLEPRIFLQGFEVKQSSTWIRQGDTVVHLDPKRFYGKFPDRDRVIEESAMLDAVTCVVRGLYEQRLARMKQELPPLAFCNEAVELARALGKLAIFNDVPVLPASWLSKMDRMPFDGVRDDGIEHLGLADEPVHRADVEQGKVVVANLDHYYAAGHWADQESLDEASITLRQHLWARAMDAVRLERTLDDGHWVHQLAAIDFDTEVEMLAEGPMATGKLGERTNLHLTAVQLCQAVTLRCGDKKVRLTEAVADPAELTIYVPVVDGEPKRVSQDVLLQIDDYEDEDDNLDDHGLEQGVGEVNAMALRLAADTPEKRLELVLTRALLEFPEARALTTSITICSAGRVKVLTLQTDPADPADPANQANQAEQSACAA